MRTATFSLISLLAALSPMAHNSDSSQNQEPTQGYVPDAATAIRIAVAVWVPIYGERIVDSEKPTPPH